MKREEFVKKYLSGQRDFRRADLRDADLSDIDLRDADLRGVDLRGANLNTPWLIVAGEDKRGYLFCANCTSGLVPIVTAGGHRFVGMKAARAHWNHRHERDLELRKQCLSLLDAIESQAVARGWRLEE